MPGLTSIGRMVMVLGVVLLIAGALMSVLGRGFRLPGDILIRRDTYTIYIPIATTIVLSLLLTLLLNLVIRR
jgi:low affinity Fe/Cu permease